MSEYWKSTPKYWCKHCKTYVRDTKLEKQNHDATPKHQGNVKRFLRDLHRGNERDEREKQRAKDEVARLNGEPGSSKGNGPRDFPSRRTAPAVASGAGLRQLTPAEYQQQMAKLAELGVAVPDEYRKEVAMAGDWQVMSETLVHDRVKKEEEDDNDVKPNGLNVGIRKRKLEGQEDEEEAVEPTARRVWGSSLRTFPGTTDDDGELDALLSKTSTNLRGEGPAGNTETGIITPTTDRAVIARTDGSIPLIPPPLKQEDSTNDLLATLPLADSAGDVVKHETDQEEAAVLFKKRRPKASRHK
ncbi:hypothetical protein MMC26_005608 [Xylographa opegraphella]|nr:hypothetical protein [Xylographa opegraphella]